ncbi:MAG: hypothetical protein ACOVJ5_01090 [Gloeomargaritales cyanobacterium]
MKKFRVTTEHTVYIDSYENGEGKQVNSYDLNSTQRAETIREAIQNHFNNTVYLPFDFDKAEISEDKTVIFWSCLVDEENEEPYTHDLEEWKQGKKELYVNNIIVSIEEIKPLIIE